MPDLWNMLSPVEQEKRKTLQALYEEDMINLSSMRYWDEYNRAPDEGYPEQQLLDTCVVHLTPIYQEWIDTIAKSTKTPAWAYPLFAVGAGKMADITLRCLMLESPVVANPTTDAESENYKKALVTIGSWAETFDAERKETKGEASLWLAANAVTKGLQFKVASRGRKTTQANRVWDNLSGGAQDDTLKVFKQAMQLV